jgi:hypothetical protein|tara:strand:- start:324 stop:545 length:222 start_codon:yes stop_codon:yes gene_type:complete
MRKQSAFRFFSNEVAMSQKVRVFAKARTSTTRVLCDDARVVFATTRGLPDLPCVNPVWAFKLRGAGERARALP